MTLIAQLQHWVADINHAYRTRRPCTNWIAIRRFEWIDGSDSQQSMLSFMPQIARGPGIRSRSFATLLPFPRYQLSRRRSAARVLAGNSEQRLARIRRRRTSGTSAALTRRNVPMHGRPYSVNLIVPPLGAIFLKSEGV